MSLAELEQLNATNADSIVTLVQTHLSSLSSSSGSATYMGTIISGINEGMANKEVDKIEVLFPLLTTYAMYAVGAIYSLY
jgi:hypothetical protein